MKKGTIKKFFEDHINETVMAGLFVAGGIAGGMIGYNCGVKRATSLIKSWTPGVVDTCGRLGMCSTLECIDRIDHSTYEHIIELLNSNINKTTVSDIYYSIPEIEALINTCSK